ncbi:MAG: hypothetical protein KME11_13370 [Timaviella obliquedivisa GSE-PSE-MK23-08B]|jgi:uncharacterized membrane protein|nr:hypothetical protein [Timaviella obliquedivisa GSE-PSE-MK23-08B]
MTGLIVVASLLVAFLVFGWLLKVVKATVGTALAIAAVVLGLQLFFGVGPEELWLQMTQIWNTQFAKIWESLWRSIVR